MSGGAKSLAERAGSQDIGKGFNLVEATSTTVIVLRPNRTGIGSHLQRFSQFTTSQTMWFTRTFLRSGKVFIDNDNNNNNNNNK